MTARNTSGGQLHITDMSAVFEFQDDPLIATPPQYASGDGGGDDVTRLRELLRPIIVDLLEDELSTYMRRRG